MQSMERDLLKYYSEKNQQIFDKELGQLIRTEKLIFLSNKRKFPTMIRVVKEQEAESFNVCPTKIKWIQESNIKVESETRKANAMW